jgi:hypothetical protein
MRLDLLAFALTAAAVASPAPAADRTFTITSFTRVRVDGGYSVKLKTGVSPFAKATGSVSALSGVSVEVQGETLIVRHDPSAWSGYPGERPGPVEVSVGTHDLSAAWVNGTGAIAIDKVGGQSFQLSVQGAGSASIDKVDVDKLQADLAGSGSMALGGRAAIVRLGINGAGSIDASALSAKDAKIEAAGDAVVKLTATNSAEVRTFGTASVDLAGKPACTVNASGSSTVSGCQ